MEKCASIAQHPLQFLRNGLIPPLLPLNEEHNMFASSKLQVCSAVGAASCLLYLPNKSRNKGKTGQREKKVDITVCHPILQ